jgi:mRNA interferase HigB
MHIISFSRLKEFWAEHANAEPSLRYWYKIVSLAEWQSFAELRQVFPSADLVNNFIVFNIGGNNYRLIAFIDFEFRKVFIRHVLTHADYDKETWKNDQWYTK